MATCPNCRSNIPDDFGLITCKACGAQVMVDFDGNASEAPPTDIVSPETSAGEALADNILFDLQSPTSPIPTAAPMAPLETKSTDDEASVGAPANSDMSDVASFGNSPISQAREGLLRFHILLNGIDTSDVRKHLREVLEDPRFLFNVDELLHAIRDGQLRIPDVTAVKASVLIQRLRSLPVEITWEQYAIHTN